ncbi:MAG: VOC family protein, partial [Planctomycetota bacterium]
EGKALEAIDFYKTIFDELEIVSMKKYKAGEAGKEGTVQVAEISIEGQPVKMIDSPISHGFTFTASFSFFVECEDEEQLQTRFEKLSKGGKVMMPVGNYGFSEKFAWVSDQFGISWQLNLK